MSYISRPPCERLQGIVERVWRVEMASTASVAETICPDGCSEVIIHLAQPMRGQPRELLVGQMDAPLAVVPSSGLEMVGARFTPTGLRRVLPVSQDQFAARIVPLDALWSGWTRRTADQVASASTPERQLQVFEDALASLLPGSHLHRDDVVEAAVRKMRAMRGPLPVDRFVRATGISRRQFERRFREHVGLSPQLFGRIIRFQHAFAAVNDEPGALLAARLGFADQAHLVRDIRRFSGQTPTLLAEAEGLTSFFANAGHA